MRPPTPHTNDLPDYCCAIITDVRGYLLLQLRPPSSQHAPGQLTCFGGRREQHESMSGCLLRELHEELAWSPSSTEVACDLWQRSQFIARFFRCRMPEGVQLRTEDGHQAVWVPSASLAGLPISPWHQTVFAALSQGRQRAELSQ
jgi:8-oxo-dGTP pyrophosphatase MutT (NUDIX family)